MDKIFHLLPKSWTNFIEYGRVCPCHRRYRKRHPVISIGHVTSKASLRINAKKIRFLAFHTAMICCQPALTAKMNNMTVMMRSLVMTSSVYMRQDWMFLLQRVSCPYSNTRYITNLSNSDILLFKSNLIVTQMSGTWSSRDNANQLWADPRLSTPPPFPTPMASKELFDFRGFRWTSYPKGLTKALLQKHQSHCHVAQADIINRYQRMG